MKKNLIVFLIPPEKMINGGIMSIFSICKVSRQFADIHQAEVVLATYPGTKSYGKNDLFENEETIYAFDDIVTRTAPESLLLHVPEYASYDICRNLRENYADYLDRVKNLHVNIMNQNILMMPKPADSANWFTLTPQVTQSIAHYKTATQTIANQYYLPTHLLTTFVDASQYQWVDYDKKDDLIVFSPDVTDEKEIIMTKLKKAFPDYEFITIQDMTFDTYKKTIRRAKFAITFGEGFDGYYLEAFFSGGVTFAVYNEDFFPDSEFASFGNIFASYNDMINGIIDKIHTLNNKATYEKLVKQNFTKLTELYNFERYTSNVKKFYEGDYTFTPEPGSGERLIGEVILHKEAQAAGAINDRDIIIEQQNTVLAQKNNEMSEKDSQLRAKNQELTAMLNSKSWKITKPLRHISSKLH